MRWHTNTARSLWALSCLVACGDNLPGPEVPDAPGTVDAGPDPGLAFFEMPMLPGYNHASETVVAALGGRVVVLATHQAFPSADSFEYPTSDDDPDHPFRRIGFVTSADAGSSYSAPTPLVMAGRSDPVIGAALDGSFWATATDSNQTETDVLHSIDGATFTPLATTMIIDKSWIAIDETRQAVWVGGFGVFTRIGFDGTVQAVHPQSNFGLASAFADNIGFHAMSDESYQAFAWDGVNDIQFEGAQLSAGAQATIFTRVSAAMGTADGATWIVRALHDNVSGSPIVARVRRLPDEGHDVPISPAGTVGFLPAAALDADGRLHVAWYDSSGPFGELVYAHSETSDLAGAYTQPIVVDGDACPGNGWYPYSSDVEPFGGRRLREYIGIAVTGRRAIISWTHAPDPPSRIRIAHLDF